jgi:hypothetical protein
MEALANCNDLAKLGDGAAGLHAEVKGFLFERLI